MVSLCRSSVVSEGRRLWSSVDSYQRRDVEYGIEDTCRNVWELLSRNCDNWSAYVEDWYIALLHDLQHTARRVRLVE